MAQLLPKERAMREFFACSHWHTETSPHNFPLPDRAQNLKFHQRAIPHRHLISAAEVQEHVQSVMEGSTNHCVVTGRFPDALVVHVSTMALARLHSMYAEIPKPDSPAHKALCAFFEDDGSWQRTRPPGASYTFSGKLRPVFYHKEIVYDSPARPDCHTIIGIVNTLMKDAGKQGEHCLSFHHPDETGEPKGTKEMLISEDAMVAMRTALGMKSKLPGRGL